MISKMNDSFERRVELSLVSNEESSYVVSTVEIPHYLYGPGIHETMVFTKSDWDSDECYDRYSTRERSLTEALETHRKVCEALDRNEYEKIGDQIYFDFE